MEPYSEERLRSGPAELALSQLPPLAALRLPPREERLRELLSDESSSVRRTIAADIARLPSIGEDLGRAVMNRFVLETEAPVLQALVATLPKLPMSHGERCAVIGALLAEQRLEVRRTVLELLRVHPGTFGDLRGVLFVVNHKEKSLELRELVEDVITRIHPSALHEMELRQREFTGLMELPVAKLLPHEFFWPLLLEDEASARVGRAFEQCGAFALSSAGSIAVACYALRALVSCDPSPQQVVIDALARWGGSLNAVSDLLLDFARTTTESRLARYAMSAILQHELGGSEGAQAAADRLIRSRRGSDGEAVARKLDRLSVLCGVTKASGWAEQLLVRRDPEITSLVLSVLARAPQLIGHVRDRLSSIAIDSWRERSTDRAEALRLLSLGARHEVQSPARSPGSGGALPGPSQTFEERVESLARVLVRDADDTVATQALSTLGSLSKLTPDSRAALIKALRSGSEEQALSAATALLHRRHIDALSPAERSEVRAMTLQWAAAYDGESAEDPLLVASRRTFLELYLELTPVSKAPRWVRRSCAAIFGFWLDCRQERGGRPG